MPNRESVVLLHGLGRGTWSMVLLAQRLRRAGFDVHNLRYPARPRSLEQAVHAVERQVAKRELDRVEGIHWVGYSLGGLVARACLASGQGPGPGRLVMIAPPNQGSEVVDVIGRSPLFRLFLGDVAAQLGTREGNLPASLDEVDVETGIVAGSRWINPIGGLLLGSEHDGSVTVDSTRLPGMSDHVVVPHSHTFIMNSGLVARETVSFLRSGHFEATSSSAAA